MGSVLIRTVIIYLFLSFSIKIMGKRQIGELESGELISTLLISEVASLPIDNPDIPLSSAIFPILLWFLHKRNVSNVPLDQRHNYNRR